MKSLDVVVKDPGGGGSNMRMGSGPQWSPKALYYVRVVGNTPTAPLRSSKQWSGTGFRSE